MISNHPSEQQAEQELNDVAREMAGIRQRPMGIVLAAAKRTEKLMPEELKPQIEDDQPIAPELSEQELNEVAGAGGGGSGAHPIGPPPPAP